METQNHIFLKLSPFGEQAYSKVGNYIQGMINISVLTSKNLSY